MNDPLKKFKCLVVHPRAGQAAKPSTVPVQSVASAAVYLADLLCQGYQAGHIGTTVHVFDPRALGTVPYQIWRLHAPDIAVTPLGRPGEPTADVVGLSGRSHSPNASQRVPTRALPGSNVVPIDAAHALRGNRGSVQ